MTESQMIAALVQLLREGKREAAIRKSRLFREVYGAWITPRSLMKSANAVLKEDAELRARILVEHMASNLGEVIKDARTNLKFTQTELATATNVSGPRICRIEKGKAFPSIDLLARIAYTLCVSFTVNEEEHWTWEDKSELETVNE